MNRDQGNLPAGLPRPEAGEIHVWRVCLRSKRQHDPEILAWLEDRERERAAAFRNPEGRQRYITTRLQLRSILGRYLGCPPGEIILRVGEHGKPYLGNSVSGLNWGFNVSHSEQQALIAIAPDAMIGVDLERVKPRRHLARLASHVLSPGEMARWQEHPAERQTEEFTRTWVGKEAFVKAVGRGISLGLRRLSLRSDGTGLESLPAEYGHPHEWPLETWREATYWCAVAYRGPRRRLRLIDASPLGHGLPAPSASLR